MSESSPEKSRDSIKERCKNFLKLVEASSGGSEAMATIVIHLKKKPGLLKGATLFFKGVGDFNTFMDAAPHGSLGEFVDELKGDYALRTAARGLKEILYRRPDAALEAATFFEALHFEKQRLTSPEAEAEAVREQVRESTVYAQGGPISERETAVVFRTHGPQEVQNALDGRPDATLSFESKNAGKGRVIVLGEPELDEPGVDDTVAFDTGEHFGFEYDQGNEERPLATLAQQLLSFAEGKFYRGIDVHSDQELICEDDLEPLKIDDGKLLSTLINNISEINRDEVIRPPYKIFAIELRGYGVLKMAVSSELGTVLLLEESNDIVEI